MGEIRGRGGATLSPPRPSGPPHAPPVTPSLPPSVRPLVARLAAEPEVRRVVLFGSRARGDGRERSDVDLALDAPGLSRAGWVRLCADAEEADTLYSVDLVLLSEAPAPLRERIDAEGVALDV